MNFNSPINNKSNWIDPESSWIDPESSWIDPCRNWNDFFLINKNITSPLKLSSNTFQASSFNNKKKNETFILYLPPF